MRRISEEKAAAKARKNAPAKSKPEWKIFERDAFLSEHVDHLDRVPIPIDDYEKALALRWCANAFLAEDEAGDASVRHSVSRKARFFATYGRSMGLADDIHAMILPLTPASRDTDETAPDELAAIVLEISKIPLPEPSAFQTRIDWFCGFFGATRDEIDLVSLALRVNSTPEYGSMMVGLERSSAFVLVMGGVLQGFTAAGVLLHASGRNLRHSLVAGPLAVAGITTLTGEGRGTGYVPHDPDPSASRTYAVSRIATEILFSDADTVDDIVRIAVPDMVPSVLEPADFEHLGTATDDICRIVQGACRDKEKGIGVVLTGPVGTGKTEFARLIGSRTGLRTVFIGEQGRNEAEPKREDRLSHLLFMATISAHYGDMLLVVDEAEDIFLGVDSISPLSRKGSKIFLNSRIESLEMPVLWITNQPASAFGSSVLRRMSYHADFTISGDAVRRRIARRVASRNSVDLTDVQVEEIVGINPSPAVVDNGFRTARLLQGDMDTAIKAMRTVQETITGPSVRRRMRTPYDTSLSNADTDIVVLENEIVASGRLDFSLMISGMSGTGKSAFARNLAERLELEVMLVKASDIFGKYVGETEKAIASTFVTAERTRSLLIVDEADSLFQDRRHAVRNWEISQVNELLTWMEDHPYPFVATTNLVDRFDPATRRRFDFKIGFLPMTREQIGKAFVDFFGFAAVRDILALENMTPGDLSVVKRQSSLRGISDPLIISEMVRLEVEGKEGRRAAIGF